MQALSGGALVPLNDAIGSTLTCSSRWSPCPRYACPGALSSGLSSAHPPTRPPHHTPGNTPAVTQPVACIREDDAGSCEPLAVSPRRREKEVFGFTAIAAVPRLCHACDWTHTLVTFPPFPPPPLRRCRRCNHGSEGPYIPPVPDVLRAAVLWAPQNLLNVPDCARCRAIYGMMARSNLRGRSRQGKGRLDGRISCF